MKEEDEIVDTFVEEAVSEDEILESIPRLVHTLFSHYGASTLYGVFTSSFETSINLLLVRLKSRSDTKYSLIICSLTARR